MTYELDFVASTSLTI